MEEKKHSSNGIPTFDMIPMLMANLLEDNKILSAKLDAINKKIASSVANSSKDEDQRMDVTEVQKYIPGHPAVQTIYGWTSNSLIPYHKVGKRIYFVKSELDAWLSQEQHKSQDDLRREAEEYVNKKRRMPQF
ncbi:MAG: helix-turn-helix domain-containing protein [Bacteroidaceae bacterium]|nr:helix-turn-helix domain-containing protein [Bacteroidaceae bacterium]